MTNFKNLVAILIIAICGLIGLCVYLYYFNENTNILLAYEKNYTERADFINKNLEKSNKRPLDFTALDSMHDGCGRDTVGKRFKSVWVDETTIMHLAYFILTHKNKGDTADGVRIYSEKYGNIITETPSGNPCHPNTISLALMVTKKNPNPFKAKADTIWHLDWLVKKPELENDPNKYALDNYNDPCPGGTNCGNLDTKK